MSVAEPSQGNRAHRFTLEALIKSIQQLEFVQLVSLLTLFLAVIFPFDHWVFIITARVCLFLFLVFPIIIRKPAFWAALARLVNGNAARLRARRMRVEMTTSDSGPVPRSHSPLV